ncbi:MAG: 30S ribosomal protein S13 [Nanoarchaeota archaeon]|nr:MAG: 30S ribosomal protein S13 [Nanoarchaeota archaeon]
MAKEELPKDFRYLVRVHNTDLDGQKPIYKALCKIRGISFSMSNAICASSGVEKTERTGTLNESQIQKLDNTIKNISELIPEWMLNRRKDSIDGVSRHVYMGDLQYSQEQDIRMMKKIRSYKGVRHSIGQPVRGQRTRSNFRRNKGKGPGVIRSKQTKAANAEKENKK